MRRWSIVFLLMLPISLSMMGEMQELTSLIRFLDSVCQSSNDDSTLWKRDSSSVWSSQSFLACLSSPSHYPLSHIANFLCKAKVPHKVRAFVWVMDLRKINPNNMLQKWLFHKIMCALLCKLWDLSTHVLHHDLAHCHWSKLFGVIERSGCDCLLFRISCNLTFWLLGGDKEKNLSGEMQF